MIYHWFDLTLHHLDAFLAIRVTNDDGWLNPALAIAVVLSIRSSSMTHFLEFYAHHQPCLHTILPNVMLKENFYFDKLDIWCNYMLDGSIVV